MAESDFQTELGRGFRNLTQTHYHKLWDMPAFLARKQRENRQVVLKNPYDCYCLHYGLFVAMELKQPNGLSIRTQSPNSGDLTPEQEADLLAAEANGGAGLVVVNFLVKLSAREQKKRGGLELIDRTWCQTISRVVEARRECAANSIPLDWWEKHGVELPACKVENNKHAWDPRPLLSMAREWRRSTPWGA